MVSAVVEALLESVLVAAPSKTTEAKSVAEVLRVPEIVCAVELLK